MKIVHVEKSIGMIVGHDMTEIIPGKSKKAAFKKGHVIKKEDIPRLLSMGKKHIAIIELGSDDIHENDAAVRMAKASSGEGISFTEPSEGKVSMIAEYKGLLKINPEALHKINGIEDIMMATIHSNVVIEKNGLIGGTRIIPLSTKLHNIEKMESICDENYPVIKVIPLKKMKIGIVTTGSEVYNKRIEDKFGPVLKSKFDELDCQVIDQIIVDDDIQMISEGITSLIEKGAELIACTGGMSVDPDDVTPLGIKRTGALIEGYGAPALPGAMFMLAYHGNVPIVGLPGCVMYSRRTIFDLIVPRLLAGEKVKKEDIDRLGYGGLCVRCSTCTYPNCGFGKNGF